ncbi:hypothetical protein [Burkholderia sp. Ac-20353]|uniref:hypothetical protein n=1 Tax=Burkholderia sp. Ac-20353 TaxID=2703894 RepID=UPI00197BB4C4|nr:hypothetical protein [Burkholderia sp. Ac-20353]MBN3788304.1 hypothetical protein [Burkholderia sp. Ac-20353]
MSIVEGFERKALFTITRGVALVCVTVLLAGIVVGALYGVSVWQQQVTTKVSPQEIVDQLKPAEPPAPAPQSPQGARPPADQTPPASPLQGYRIPFNLQNYASGDNAQVIKRHLDDVPEVDRQEYLDEMGAVVAVTDASKVDAVDAINAYMKTKAERYTAAAAKRVEKWETLKFVGEVAVGGLMLIALFSLVLVLLAIERNTRPLRREASRVAPHTESEALKA